LYSPWYHHYFSDQELHDIVVELKLVKDLRGTPSPAFRHLHWSFQGRKKDEFDVRNDKHFWADDYATYHKRKSLSVEEKIKLPDWWSE
jgi:hypothetical protein